jgi:two-component system NarL family sensor kinase
MGVLSMVVVSVIFYNAFSKALLERTFAQLSSINILKKVQVEEYILQQQVYDTSRHTPHISGTIAKILHERTGMGETGETYLVNAQKEMISLSRFFPQTGADTIWVNTPAVAQALIKGEGYGVIEDYRHVKVLSYYRLIQLNNLNWVIISEIDYQEAIKPVHKVRNYIIGVVILMTIVIVYITGVLSDRLAHPIKALQQQVEKLSKGKIPEQKVTYTDQDEIGHMVEAIHRLIEGIKQTTTFAYETGQGNFEASFRPLSDEDVLGNTLLQMRDKIVELQQKQLSLERHRSAALLEGQDKERTRLARELHDGLGQLLTGIRFKIDAADGSEVSKEEIKKLLDETIGEVRRISHSAMPAALTDFGLEAALRALCMEASKLGNVQIEYDYFQEYETDMPLHFEISISLYRIAQEGLNNLLKYSKASKALLELHQTRSTIVLELSDNGTGFVLSEREGAGNGLRNIRERVKLCGGKVEFFSEIGKGTRIRVEIPLMENEEKD